MLWVEACSLGVRERVTTKKESCVRAETPNDEEVYGLSRQDIGPFSERGLYAAWQAEPLLVATSSSALQGGGKLELTATLMRNGQVNTL